MKTKIDPQNPFGYDRHGFAWQSVPADSPAHLDFGCGPGQLPAALRAKGVRRRVGVEVSREAAARAHQSAPDIEVVHIGTALPLPFADKTFSSISVLDVLEHVSEQVAVLRELRRILADDGVLIVTVPGQHCLSFLDAGNFKFLFPRLHRWYCLRRHTRQEYDNRYVANCDGLIGDISARKRWHEHFSRRKLGELLRQGGFEVIRFDGAGLFYRPLSLLSHVARCQSQLAAWIQRMLARDAQRWDRANLFCVARKAIRDRP